MTYQNGTNISPIASTGARNRFPIAAEMQIPAAASPREQAQRIPNICVRFVSRRISCASVISRRKRLGFLRLVASFIWDFMLFGLARIRENIPSVNSMGDIPKSMKKPAVKPTQATISIAVISCSPFRAIGQVPPAAFRFQAICAATKAKYPRTFRGFPLR